MKKLFTLLTMLVLGIGSMWATTYTITYGTATGTFYRNGKASTDWSSKWVSNEEGKPVVTITTSVNNMNGANARMAPQTYKIFTEPGYKVTGFAMNCPTFGATVTVTPSGESAVEVAQGGTLVVNSSASSFVFAGGSSSARIQAGSNDGGSFTITVEEDPWATSFAEGTYLTVGDKVSSFTAATAADDNDHWYILTQAREGETPMYDNGLGNQLKRAATSVTLNSLNGALSSANDKYLIRFKEVGEGTYNIQFANGNWIDGNLNAANANTVGTYAFYNCNGGSGSYFAWNLNGKSGRKVDNNGAGYTVSFWGSGETSGSSGNNVWYMYETTLEVPNTTYVYEISDASGVVYTSGAYAGIPGESITEMPSDIQREYCSYEVTSTTLDAGENTVPVTVTYNLPFTLSTSFESAKWYYATLRGKQLRADESHKDDSGRYQTNSTNERTDVYKWAFFGNPYTGIYVMNKNQGDGKYMYKETQIIFSNPADPTADNKALWAITSNSNGGFTLRNIDGGATWYVNDAGNGGNLGFWNNGNGKNDAGSNWLVEKAVDSDKELLGTTITYAQTLVNGAGVLGYPSEAGASTLSTAITTAQGVYDDAGGDYFGAYNTLVTAIETAKATISYIPRTDKYYTITSVRGSMVYDSSHDAQVDAEDKKFLWYTTSLDATNVNHLWGFIEQDGNYYMYNVGKQQFATVSTSGSYQLNDKGTWAFSDTPAYVTFDQGINNSVAAPYVRVRATIATTSTTYSMSISTSYVGPVITYDAQGDGGIPMVLAESSVEVDPDITDIMTSKVTDLTPFREALQDVIDACKAKVGTGLNQYASNETYETVLEAAEAEVDDEDATKGSLQDAKSYLETAYAALSLNLPATGKFYRIKGNTSGKYLAAGKANDKYAMSDAENATTIFYFNESNQLMNYNDGKYNAVSSNSWDWADNSTGATTVTFHDGHTNGGYGIQSSDIYLYDGGSNADRGKDVNMETDNVRYRSWYLEEVTSLPARSESYNTITIAPAGTEVDSSVPNVLVYTSPNTYTCVNLQLDDNTIPQVTGLGFTGTNVTYTRAATTRNWGTICLPYKPAEVDGIDYYELTSSSENSLTFTKVDYADVKAYTPYMFKNTTGEAVSATATGVNFMFLSGEIGKAKEFSDGYKLIGIQKNSSIVDGVNETEAVDESYQVIEDANAYYFKNSDSKFYPLYERFNMKALRCYLTSTSEGARQSVLGFAVDDDGSTTGVNFIESEDGKTVDIVFDLNGRRHNQMQKGINIVNGKKVFK